MEDLRQVGTLGCRMVEHAQDLVVVGMTSKEPPLRVVATQQGQVRRDEDSEREQSERCDGSTPVRSQRHSHQLSLGSLDAQHPDRR